MHFPLSFRSRDERYNEIEDEKELGRTRLIT